MNEQKKRQLVDDLIELSLDASTNPWSARLYFAAALRLEAERDRAGEDRTSVTIAAERVKKRTTDKMPIGFPSFVRAWLGEALR